MWTPFFSSSFLKPAYINFVICSNIQQTLDPKCVTPIFNACPMGQYSMCTTSIPRTNIQCIQILYHTPIFNAHTFLYCTPISSVCNFFNTVHQYPVRANFYTAHQYLVHTSFYITHQYLVRTTFYIAHQYSVCTIFYTMHQYPMHVNFSRAFDDFYITLSLLFILSF
jgi:hypothetical protein